MDELSKASKISNGKAHLICDSYNIINNKPADGTEQYQ